METKIYSPHEDTTLQAVFSSAENEVVDSFSGLFENRPKLTLILEYSKITAIITISLR